MKKILILNTTLDKGGAARVAYDLFDSTSCDDFEVYFAYGRKTRKSKPIPKTFYFGLTVETFLHTFLVRFLGIEGWGSFFSTQRLIRYIEKENFDLINIHNLHGYYVNIFTLLKFLGGKNIPIIYSPHDEWPITWTPAHSMGCTHCKTGVGVCTNSYKYPKTYISLFSKYLLKKKKGAFLSLSRMIIVTPSHWLAQSFKDSFLSEFEIVVINNGIDTDIFKPLSDKKVIRGKYNLPLDKIIVSFSASDLRDPSKGIGSILQTASLLHDKPFFFIGFGKGELEGRKNVKNLGYIYDTQHLSEIYGLSDVFCFASSVETFLLSAAEALACGIPIVGFDLPVVHELVTENVGLLTDHTPLSLSLALGKVVENPEKYKSMSRSARELIVQNFSKKLFYSRYTSLYKTFLNL